MIAWSKPATLLKAAAGAAVVGPALYFGAPALKSIIGGPTPVTSEDFTKSAYDENGNLLTGPVAPGQTIQYVLRYDGSGFTGPTTIVDTLSTTQTYVAGSMQAPGWTLSTPIYNGNQETYTRAILSPPTFVLNVPAITGSAGAPGGGGDGYEPVPVVTSTGTKVFSVNHHERLNGKVMCWYGETLGKCLPTYPKRVSTSPEQRATPDLPHVVVFDKKLYFPAARYDEVAKTTLEMGMGCWDAELDAECPFVSLPGQPSLNMGGNTLTHLGNDGTKLDNYVAGVRADPANPSRIYVFALDKVYCVDVALPGAPACPGWTTPVIPPATTIPARSRDMFVEENGTRLFVTETAPVRLFCFNLTGGATCPGWPAAGVTGGATIGTTLGPSVDASGTMNAVCLAQGFGASNFRCFDLNTGAVTTTAWPGSLATATIMSAYHIPGTTRVLFPPYIGVAGSQCYDFATSAPCAPWTPYWNNRNQWIDGNGVQQFAVADYGYASDPSAPQDCIYGLGHGGILVRFALDGTAATSACAPKVYYAVFSTDDQYCFQKPTDASWTSLDILNRPSELTGGTIVIKDSTGTVIQTITIGSANSYPLNIPATGDSSGVSIEFTPIYSGNSPPGTDYQVKLNYTADEDPQICYQTTVSECGEVSNSAVLTTGEDVFEASVNLGNVAGGICSPPPAPQCLELTGAATAGGNLVTVNFGGPPGFAPGHVTLEALTGGVTVTMPEQNFTSGQTSGSWAVTGLAPGMTARFKVDAVNPGGGSKPGIDECCAGEVEVTLPRETDEDEVDLKVEKTGEPIVEGQMGEGADPHYTGYRFYFKVTNLGAGFNAANAVTVTDVVPPGMSFTSAAGTDWNCGPASQYPIASGGTLTCTYVGTAPLTTGQVLPLITVIASIPGFPTSFAVENCLYLGVSGQTDVNGANNKSCHADERHPPERPTTVTPPPMPSCDKASTRLKGGICECRYPEMKRSSLAACKCPAGTSLVPGRGCEKKTPLVCDDRSAKLSGESCKCLYPGMSKISKTMCSCPEGQILITGIGCVVPGKPASTPDAPAPGASTPGTPTVPPVALACEAPLVPNKKGDACECPKGTTLKNGKCEKKGSFFGDVLDNVNIGVGIGGGGGGSRGGGGAVPDIKP